MHRVVKLDLGPIERLMLLMSLYLDATVDLFLREGLLQHFISYTRIFRDIVDVTK